MKDTDKVIKQGLKLLEKIESLADTGNINWRTAVNPRPDAMRSFEGDVNGVRVLVVESNTVEYGIVNEGMATCEGLVVRMPRPLAKKLYQMASRSRN